LARRVGQRRHHGVVSSLEALSWLLIESPGWQDGVQVGGRSEHGLVGRNVHHWWHFSVDISSRMMQFRRSLVDCWALKSERCVGCVILEAELVPKTLPLVVTRSIISVFRLFTFMARDDARRVPIVLVVVVCVVSRVTLGLYRVSLLSVVSVILAFLLCNLIHLSECILEKKV
jgi:hypothetical protein